MKAEGENSDSSLSPRPSSFSRGAHRLALVNAVATLLLLFVGGLVTTKGAGLAVPDWPTTFGYNPFLYPWSMMVGNIFYEHSHRLVASAVGLCTVLLAVMLWLGQSQKRLRWLGVAAVALVVAQGVVGGLRVVLLEQTLAILHACLAQAFFALAVSLALFTSNEWSRGLPRAEAPDAARLQRLSLVTTGLIYLQIVFGAVLRHTGTLLEAHLIFAALVALHVMLLGARILKRHGQVSALLGPIVLLSALLFAQLALGLGAYLGKFVMSLPPIAAVTLTTSHVVVGALMLAASLVLTLRSFRLFLRGGLTRERGFIAVGTARRSEEISA